MTRGKLFKAPACEGHPDPDLWFDPKRFKQARIICRQCPVLDKCAELGEDYEYGIWGGTTPAERGFEHDEDGRDLDE